MDAKKIKQGMITRVIILFLAVSFVFVSNAFSATTLYKTWTTQGDFENNDVSQKRPTTRTNVNTAAYPGDVVLGINPLSGPTLSLITDIDPQYSGHSAYNSVSNEYLIVWRDGPNAQGNIYAQRISAAGDLLGMEFLVSSKATEQRAPRVAYNPVNNEYMVTWYEAGPYKYDPDWNIYAQRVSAAGTLIGNAISVCTEAGWQSNPAIAYSSKLNEYMITWDDNRNIGGSYYTLNITARRVSANGTLIGSEIIVSDVISRQFWPDIAYNSVNDQYMITWQDMPSGLVGYDIYAQIVNSDGTLAGPEIAVSTTIEDQGCQRIAYSSKTNTFMIVWQEYRQGNYNTSKAQIVNSDGTLAGPEIVFTNQQNFIDQWYPKIAYNPVLNEFMVTCYSWSFPSYGPLFKIYGQRISANGQLIGSRILISSSLNEQYHSMIAYNSNSNEYMTTWFRRKDSGLYDIIAQRVTGQDIPSFGNITNLKINSGVKTPFWRKMWWNADTPTGTTVKFRTRSAGTDLGLAKASWSAYYPYSGSSVTTSGYQWLEIEMRLETTDLAITPVVHDFTIEYSNTK
jgi:hypothetical protein